MPQQFVQAWGDGISALGLYEAPGLESGAFCLGCGAQAGVQGLALKFGGLGFYQVGICMGLGV